MYPIDDNATVETLFRNESLRRSISRLSPLTIYSEAVTTILNPGVRTVGLIMASQLEGAIPSVLPLGQSILLVWAHIVTMIAMTVVCFAVSYIMFMRQEIRAI